MQKIWKLYPLDNIWGDDVCRVNMGGQTSHFYVREGPLVLGGSDVIFYSSLNAGQIPEHFFQTGGSTTNNRLWLCLSLFESS